MPHCFHGKPAKLMKEPVHASQEALVSLQCAAKPWKDEKCPFYTVNVTALLNDDSNMIYSHYEFRTPLYSSKPSKFDNTELAILTDDDYTVEPHTSSYTESEDDTEIYIPVTHSRFGVSQALLQAVDQELARQDKGIEIDKDIR
ncbi:hypothetical protein CVT26_009869 [Gymnopilus dilepis]|uniref:Uncharacterized protein n=1 Tax=Gymnopilus dilepis TaxID=231916 RepID=A0A409YC70_9AGAR|nr:hypothetical protein CVT26_009869 [Gymnopilus dilepis]